MRTPPDTAQQIDSTAELVHGILDCLFDLSQMVIDHVEMIGQHLEEVPLFRCQRFICCNENIIHLQASPRLEATIERCPIS